MFLTVIMGFRSSGAARRASGAVSSMDGLTDGLSSRFMNGHSSVIISLEKLKQAPGRMEEFLVFEIMESG